jgi:N-acetylglucosaminyldiphosphoundecaprenol N-acetyl-beta-D-mannosaminyltransferase
MNSSLPSTKILGTKITTASKEDILEFISKCIEKREDKIQIVTPNPEILVYAIRSSSFQDILNNAQISLPDGVGLLAADRILEKSINERITGTDMVDDLCRLASKRAFTVGFIGGGRGVAEKASECLVKKYPNLIVLIASEDIAPASIKKHIDILFVALGAPRQEEWI